MARKLLKTNDSAWLFAEKSKTPMQVGVPGPAESYNGMFNVGYTGCRDSIPSLQRIAVYSGEELDRLEAPWDSANFPRFRRVQPAPAGQDCAMPLFMLVFLLFVVVALPTAFWFGRSTAPRLPASNAGLAERDAFIEQLRELAWQNRDVSPELSTIIIDEITQRHRQLPGGPNA